MPFLRWLVFYFRMRPMAFIVASGLALYASLSQAVAVDGSVIGDWKFVRVLDSVDVTSLDDKGARKLLGKVMVIRKEGARFDHYKCGTPNLEATRVEPDLYLQKEGGVDNSKLRLPKPVMVVDISCAIVFLKSRDLAVISWGGYFFEAARVNR